MSRSKKFQTALAANCVFGSFYILWHVRKKSLDASTKIEVITQSTKIEVTTLLEMGEITQEEMERVREIIKKCGALEKAKDMSQDHAAKAIGLIKKTSIEQEVKDFYTSFIGYVAESLEWYK